ncbi:MAG: glucose-6-phosphate dehydrogenase [Candidatus Peribacteria bacterium]|nr:glucose-6-phosphate dehydrogenase [Candidatus Peribacteria bacterium]
MLSASKPFTLILFGASGHLAQLKIYPALYTLALKKRLPDAYTIIGFARTAMTDDAFKNLVSESVRRDMGTVNEEVLAEFVSHMSYHAGQYDAVDDFATLEKKISGHEKNWQNPVRLAYLSTPPEVFTSVLHNLCDSNIHVSGKEFRVIVEKPVGHDLESYHVVRDELKKCFEEHEVYLLDHYLGKEAVRNIYYLRYANPVVERLFKNTLIHHVEISALENAGIENRAGYFEPSGTFRDMFQSHLLMMGCLLTMRLRDSDEFIRESRLEALKQFYLPPAKSLDDIALQAQYSPGMMGEEPVAGYLQEKGVAPDSRQNTYAALALSTRASRWEGVPFFLRSGKRLQKKETRITIEFNEPRVAGKNTEPNRLDIILQGEAGMRLHLQTKVGGTEPQFRPLVLEDPLVCYGDCLPEHALLLLEAIAGNQTWFLSFEEVNTAWRLIDPVQAHLQKESTPLHTYPAGSTGPAAADAWIQKNGMKWL